MGDSKWTVGDWAVFDLKVVQIKELRDGGNASVSDGFFETSGCLVPRLRPLTLASKRAVETFETYYELLSEINGNSGFNYPDIYRHFSDLSREAIDNPDDRTPYRRGEDFVRHARDYQTVIDGVALFRPTLKRSRT